MITIKSSFKIIIILITILISAYLHTYPILSQENSQNDAGSGQDSSPYNNWILVELDKLYKSKIGTDLVNNRNETGDAYDGYKFYINIPGYFQIVTSFEQTVSYVYIRISNSKGNILMDELRGEDKISTLKVPALNSGEYFLSINSYNKASLDYTFFISKLEGQVEDYAQNDAYSGSDAPMDDPVDIELGGYYKATIGFGYVEDDGNLDDRDVYSVNAPSMGYLSVKTNISKKVVERFSVEIISFNPQDSHPSWNQPIYRQIITGYDYDYSNNIEITSPLPEGGTYLISYYSAERDFSYNFSTTFIEDSIQIQNDFNMGKDASCIYNQNFQFDMLIRDNSTFTGKVGPGYITKNGYFVEDRSDCYSFILERNAKVLIYFNNTIEPELDNVPEISSNSMQLDVFNASDACPSCNPIISESDSVNHNHVNIMLNLDAGNYGFELHAFKKFSYSIEFTIIYDEPVIDNTDNLKISETDSISLPVSIPLQFFLFLGLLIPIVPLIRQKIKK